MPHSSIIYNNNAQLTSALKGADNYGSKRRNHVLHKRKTLARLRDKSRGSPGIGGSP